MENLKTFSFSLILMKDVGQGRTEKIVKIFANVETTRFVIIKTDFVDVLRDGSENCTENSSIIFIFFCISIPFQL